MVAESGAGLGLGLDVLGVAVWPDVYCAGNCRPRVAAAFVFEAAAAQVRVDCLGPRVFDHGPARRATHHLLGQRANVSQLFLDQRVGCIGRQAALQFADVSVAKRRDRALVSSLQDGAWRCHVHLCEGLARRAERISQLLQLGASAYQLGRLHIHGGMARIDDGRCAAPSTHLPGTLGAGAERYFGGLPVEDSAPAAALATPTAQRKN